MQGHLIKRRHLFVTNKVCTSGISATQKLWIGGIQLLNCLLLSLPFQGSINFQSRGLEVGSLVNKSHKSFHWKVGSSKFEEASFLAACRYLMGSLPLLFIFAHTKTPASKSSSTLIVVLFFARRLALMAAIFSTDIASLKDLPKKKKKWYWIWRPCIPFVLVYCRLLFIHTGGLIKPLMLKIFMKCWLCPEACEIL